MVKIPASCAIPVHKNLHPLYDTPALEVTMNYQYDFFEVPLSDADLAKQEIDIIKLKLDKQRMSFFKRNTELNKKLDELESKLHALEQRLN